MNYRVVTTLTLMLTFMLTTFFSGCRPITNSADAPYYGAGSSYDIISDETVSMEDFASSGEVSSSVLLGGGETSSAESDKGHQIIVDDSKDVGDMDDPEDPQRPSSSGEEEEKPPTDTIIIKPSTSTGTASSKPLSSVTVSKPSSNATSSASSANGSSGANSSKPSSSAPSDTEASSAPSSSAASSSQPPVSSSASSLVTSSGVTSSEGSSSSDTTTSIPSASAPSQPEKPPFAPPDNEWYDYEGKRYLYQDGKPVTGYQTIGGLTYFFAEDGSVSSKVGIDVSKFQGDIDWSKVKAAGVDYAIIRIGYRGYGAAGNIAKDPKFLQNLVNATSVGIDCGLYFFTQAKTKAEGVEEAEYVIKWIQEAKEAKDKDGKLVWPESDWRYLNYPIYFDTEMSTASVAGTGRADKLTKSERTQTAIGFCETLIKAKYYPGIYASTSWLNNQLDMSKLREYDVWVAHYGASKPGYTGNYQMWQYSSKGAIDGIVGNVDLNVGLVDYAALLKKDGWNHLTASASVVSDASSAVSSTKASSKAE